MKSVHKRCLSPVRRGSVRCLAAAAALALGAAAITAAAAADLTFEAEAASKITPPFRIQRSGLASGGAYVIQPLKSGRPPVVNCVAIYNVRITTPGRYHIWGRALWPNGCANSVDLSVDGGSRVTLGQDGTYNRWHWVPVKGHSFNLRSGVHRIEMLNREDGPALDEFYLTTDEDYVPAGAVHPTPAALVR